MDLTDAFDTRLEALQRSGKTPRAEIDAAIAVYERLRSARAICQSLLGAEPPAAAVVAVLAEISAEVHAGHGERDD